MGHHPVPGQRPVPGDDRLGDLGVRRVKVVERDPVALEDRVLPLSQVGERLHEQVQGGVGGQPGHQHVEVVQALRLAGGDLGGLGGQEGPDLGHLVFADPRRDALDAENLDGEPGVLELARLDLLEVQVDGHRLGHRLRIGLPDEQAPVQPAAHLGQAVMLQKPDRLAEDGPADAVTRDQLHLAAEQLSRLPALAYNRLLDLVSDYLCLFQGDVSLLTAATTGSAAGLSYKSPPKPP